MSASSKKLIVPTADEDARIRAGIDADPDTYELDRQEFQQLKKVGRPRSAAPKVLLSVRYDRDVVDAFKAQGPGWQRRMNAALRDWLKTHGPA